MNHTEWLRTRTPEAPTALVTCIASLLAANPAWEALPRAEAYIEASDALLRRVLEEGDAMDRESSLDLLAADACVTYAFEAAADEPSTIVGRAVHSVSRIAAIAADFRSASRVPPPVSGLRTPA